MLGLLPIGQASFKFACPARKSTCPGLLVGTSGSLYVSRKLPTYPSPKPTLCPKSEVSVNVGLREEGVAVPDPDLEIMRGWGAVIKTFR